MIQSADNTDDCIEELSLVSLGNGNDCENLPEPTPNLLQIPGCYRVSASSLPTLTSAWSLWNRHQGLRMCLSAANEAELERDAACYSSTRADS